jgi:hypothetical protein
VRKRSAYRPKAILSDPLTLLMPPTKAQKQALMLRFLTALDAMASGSHPGDDEWRDLSDAINTVETLVRQKKLAAAEVMPTLNAAIAAMVGAASRYKAGQRMGFDGPGIKAVREVIDVYGQCLDGFTAREMAFAQAETQREVNRLLHSKTGQREVIEI